MTSHQLVIADQSLSVSRLVLRRRAGESSFATITIPHIAAFEGVQGLIGAEFRITNRVGDTFVHALLTEVDAECEPFAAAIMLRGRVINPPFTAQTWRATGVIEFGQDESGRRYVCCDPLPLLRPNDTLIAGSETWNVQVIDAHYTPAAATFRVQEE